MAHLVPPESIEKIVGVPRDQTKHIARAVSGEEQVYILHSQECVDSGIGLLNCEFTHALDDTDFSTHEQWKGKFDNPQWVEVYSGDLVPAWHEIDDAERFKPGARVRVKDDAGDAWDCNPGQEYLIEAYVDKTERDDPLPYYMVGTFDGLGGYAVPHVALAQVMSAEAHAEAMKMPEPEDIAQAIAAALHLMDDGLPIHTTEVEDSTPNDWPEGKHEFKHGVTLYGRTSGGRAFGATIRITALWQTDD